MEINIVAIIVILILAGVAWYANAKLNTIPILVNVVQVLIVVISVLMLLNACGLMGSSAHIVIR